MRCRLMPCLGALALLILPTAHGALAGDAGRLHIFNYTDYTSPDLLKRFTAETGIVVTVDTFDSNETMLAKLKAGATGYDVIVAQSDFVPIMIDQKLVQAVDVAAMPNFKNLEPRWQHRTWDPDARYTVPWQWGTTSFIYDTKVYPGQVDSLSTFFDPPTAFEDRIGQLGSPSEVINLALIYLGQLTCNGDPATLKKVQALLEMQKPRVKVYNSDGVIDRMVSGETTMSAIWSGDAERARTQKPTLRYIYAKEGGAGWMDNIAVAADAPDLDNAKAFLNFMMDPKNAALETTFTGYQNAVSGSNAFLDAGLAASPEFNPPKDYAITFTHACSAEVTKNYDRIWTLLRR